jgi:hypothetical protein
MSDDDPPGNPRRRRAGPGRPTPKRRRRAPAAAPEPVQAPVPEPLAAHPLPAEASGQPPDTGVVVLASFDDEWRMITNPAVLQMHLSQVIAQDGQRRRAPPFLAAASGAICLVEVLPGLSGVPEMVLDLLLAAAPRVLVTDTMRAGEPVFALAVGLAASFGRAVLVETAPGCVEAWRRLAERCGQGCVIVLPSPEEPPVHPMRGAVVH